MLSIETLLVIHVVSLLLEWQHILKIKYKIQFFNLSLHNIDWWLTCNGIKPCLVWLVWMLFSSKQQWVTKATKITLAMKLRTSNAKSKVVLIDYVSPLAHTHRSFLYNSTLILSLYNSLNLLLSLYNSTCDLHGFYLTVFIYFNS
jgi:hypothetical protein